MRTRAEKPACGGRVVEKSTFAQGKSRSALAIYATACGSKESASRNVEYVGAEAPTP
jgi:hypothetical protein